MHHSLTQIVLPCRKYDSLTPSENLIKYLVSALFAASVLVGLPLAAHADSVTLTLTNPTLSAAMGTAANFQATLLAAASNGATEYINGDNINFSGPGTINDTAFFNGFYTTETFAPGQTSTSGLFSINLPANALPGSYSGVFQLFGGPTDSSSALLATVPFTVNATAASAPEISASGAVDGVILLSGCILILGGRRRLNGNDWA